MLGLSHDDGGLPVGREIDVIGIIHGNGLARFAGTGVDRRQAAVGAALGIVRHPQRAQIPGRHDVLRADPDFEAVDHLERVGVDH